MVKRIRMIVVALQPEELVEVIAGRDQSLNQEGKDHLLEELEE